MILPLFLLEICRKGIWPASSEKAGSGSRCPAISGRLPLSCYCVKNITFSHTQNYIYKKESLKM
jgi:hypothetical protein